MTLCTVADLDRDEREKLARSLGVSKQLRAEVLVLESDDPEISLFRFRSKIEEWCEANLSAPYVLRLFRRTHKRLSALVIGFARANDAVIFRMFMERIGEEDRN